MKKHLLTFILLSLISLSANSQVRGDHEYVDLGLSVKWATMNIGASKPEEYGDYFAWGETAPKLGYSWNTYKWGCITYDNKMTKYHNSDYAKITLHVSDDAAHANWGGSWRMPTHEEIDELCKNCTSTLTTKNGVYGRKFVGPNGNSIFLPAAGFLFFSSLFNACSIGGYYWSSSLNDGFPYEAFGLYFNKSRHFRSGGRRFYGFPVRAVCP